MLMTYKIQILILEHTFALYLNVSTVFSKRKTPINGKIMMFEDIFQIYKWINISSISSVWLSLFY
jgi:hypothetical protein